MTGLMLECAVRSHPGRVRANNEDAAFASPRMAAVADGVGGAAAGEVASRTVIYALMALDKCLLNGSVADALEAAVGRGNDTIAFIAGCRPAMTGMSTTLTAVALDGDGYVIANVGDSRTYLLRDDELRLVTKDDTLVQALIDDRRLTPAEARRHPQRSVVLHALDGAPETTATISALPARHGDRLLLCSDGLSDMIDEDAIAAALRHGPRGACTDELIDLALAAGGHDNVSAIVADVTPAQDAGGGWA
jgi:PPM family protein phosphatase